MAQITFINNETTHINHWRPYIHEEDKRKHEQLQRYKVDNLDEVDRSLKKDKLRQITQCKII